MREHPFYGKEIHVHKEKKIIDRLVAPFKKEPATEELKKKIYETLADAKASGIINVPFTVKLHKDSDAPSRNIIEILIETKV